METAMAFVALIFVIWSQYKQYELREELLLLHELEAMRLENWRAVMEEKSDEYGNLVERIIESNRE